MLPAMHYRLRYRQLIIEQISVLTIVIEVAAAPPTPEAEAASVSAARVTSDSPTGAMTGPANQAPDLPALPKRVDSCDEVDCSS